MSTEAALLAAIVADPDDDTARLVYADFLQEHGDESQVARAQFIRAQVELARPAQTGEGTRRRGLLSTAKRLHKQHGTAWAAPVFDALGTENDKYAREIEYDDWDRGFRDWVVFDNLAAFRERAPAVLALTPITGMSLRKFNNADVRKLVAEPALRTVKRLGFSGSSTPNRNIGDDTATVLAASPHLERLEELNLIQNRITTEGIRALANAPGLSRLKALGLYGNDSLNDETYAMLVGSPLGRRMTDWNVCGSFAITSEAGRILARATHLTQIRTLSFDNTRMGDEGVETLANASHLSSVRELDFRNTSLTDRGVRALARSPVFANLERLNFVKTWINGLGAKALRDSPYLKKIKFIALYDAVPRASEKKLSDRFGRKVEFGRV